MPDFELVTVDGARGPVLVVDRFDRDEHKRIGYISAMTLLEAADGDEHSYTEIAEALEPVSPTAERDLKELWRRMVFGILISNTDDHLRNHGFLRKAGGWQLAPAFDLNPSTDGGRHTFATMVDVGAGDQNTIDTALEVGGNFRLEAAAARAILAEVVEVTVQWRDYARQSGIADAEIGELRSAFEHDQATAARTAIT